MSDPLAEFHVEDRVREALTTMQSIPEPVVAIEAFWDGDTSGWYLCLVALADTYTAEQRLDAPPHPHPHDNPHCHPRYKVFQLCILRARGGDLRLFNRQVPPWPEGQAATIIGSHLAQVYQIPFYFVSPDDPDDDCPRWWQQHLARPCRECQKLIVPSTSPYSQPDLCYSCELRARYQTKRSQA